jgi:hypothetical protein
MKVVNTSSWPYEKVAAYGAEITAAFGKLRDRFPREVTIEHLFGEIMLGRRVLWLILTDDDEFVSFVLTMVQVNEATGLKTMVIPSFAGDEGLETVPLISELEEWGRQQGCDESLVYGRRGWKPALAKEGYSLDMAIFRKPL